MDQESVREIIKATYWPRTVAPIALGALALFLAVLTVAELKGIRFIGSGVTATNTITVSGEGEVFAVPDTATFSVTVQEEKKTVKEAQDIATRKNNEIIAYLTSQGVEKKDIQTSDYNVYPQYDYLQSVCREGYCPPGRQELRGFQVSMTLAVKVRDTEKAGDILSRVGELGASQVSGLSFTIDDEDALQAEARGKAITDARTKAAELAKQLNVELVRIVGFNENSGGYPTYYAKGMGGAVAMDSTAPVPEIATGQNKVTSNVSVTYEVR